MSIVSVSDDRSARTHESQSSCGGSEASLPVTDWRLMCPSTGHTSERHDGLSVDQDISSCDNTMCDFPLASNEGYESAARFTPPYFIASYDIGQTISATSFTHARRVDGYNVANTRFTQVASNSIMAMESQHIPALDTSTPIMSPSAPYQEYPCVLASQFGSPFSLEGTHPTQYGDECQRTAASHHATNIMTVLPEVALTTMTEESKGLFRDNVAKYSFGTEPNFC